MSKNLTLKGAAFGALVALGTSVFASAPAIAAETLSLAISSGTTYNVLTTTQVQLDAGFAGSESEAATGTLKYRVTNAGGATLAFADVVEAGSSATTISDITYNTANTNAAATAADVVVFADNTPAIGSANSIAFAISSHDANYSVGVQAWLDLDGDNAVDSNEATSPARTVNFIKASNVTATTSFTTPQVADASLYATVALSNDININQLDADDVLVTFYKDGNAIPTYAVRANSSAVASVAISDKTDVKANPGNAVVDSGVLKATFTPADIDAEATGATTPVTVVTTPLSVAASSTYSARASLYNGTDWTLAGNQVNTGVAAVTVDRIKTSVVASNGAKTTATGVQDATTSGDRIAGTAVVRVATSSFDVTAALQKTDETSVGAGKVVRVTVTATGLATADAVTVGGKAITSADTISLEYTSDAAGKITVPVVSTGADATETLVFNFSTEGVTTTTDEGKLTVTFTAQQFTIVNASDLGASTRAITDGSALSIKYAVVDQWGSAPAAGNFVYVERVESSARATANAAWIKSAAVGTDGYATVDITDNGSGAGADTIRATLRTKVGEGWSAATDVSNGSDQLDFTLNYVAAADATAGSLTVAVANDGTTTAEPLETSATFGNHHATIDVVKAAPAPASTNSDDVVTITVLKANGTALVGVPVTVSAAGLLFKEATSGSADVFAVGSITSITNSSGQVTVTAYGQKAGTQTVTATVGSLSASKTIKYAAAAETVGTVLTVSSVATSETGKTVTVTAKLVDKFGNPVDTADNTSIAFSATGPGFFSSKDTDTDATGTATASYVVNANDNGTVKFTVVYDTTVTDGDLTSSSSTVFAAVTAGSATVVAGAASITSGFTTNVTVTVKDAAGVALAGRTVSLSSTGVGFLNAASGVSDANGQVTVKFVSNPTEAGSAAITATVDGKTASATITVAAPVVPEAAATIAAGTAKVEFTINNAKGELVQIKIGNKTVKTFTAYSNAHAFGVKAAKGTQAVKVYVAGDLVAAKTVSVK